MSVYKDALDEPVDTSNSEDELTVGDVPEGSISNTTETNQTMPSVD
jgi:hypothetical protein